ncbi:hypothetical protein COTS27_00948 [Spirochaetota bacterium]|nr:hypothetical protein COTS27_00948 [Spirochaetota bacterium]
MNEEKKIQLQGSNEIAKGNFSNISIINHDASSFVMDFAYLPPGMTKGSLSSRIIMTPSDLKQFYFTLNDNIQKYEKRFGKIQISKQ